MNKLRYRLLKKPLQNRQVKDVILIVHEGKSTEYNYFSGIKREGRISNLQLKGPYPDPKTLILETIKLIKKNAVDHVYCVFDHDGRKSFQSALDLINLHNKKHHIKIEPITSNPCFEIWFLLHYIFTTKSYHPEPPKSASYFLIKEIQKHFPQFKKNHPSLYQTLKDKTSRAIKHAEKLSLHQKHDRHQNPHTDVYKLVKRLTQYKS